MADSHTFPSDKEDERERRLIRDLRHMYHTEGEIAQALSRVRSHLETSRTGRSDIRPSTQQRDGLLSTLQAGSGQADGHGTSTRFSQRKAWQQRAGSIAAAVFVTLLVGSLIVVLTRARHNSPGGPSNNSKQFGAISSIHMLDAQTGWAVTNKNRILRTTDGGVHWKNVTPNFPPSMTRQRIVADFLTASSAWVAVSGIDITGQGDDRARKQPSGAWVSVSGIAMATTVIFRTTNAGQTWQQAPIQTSRGIVTQVNFVTSQDGWLLSKHPVSESAETLELFRTADGGGTWVKIASALAASLDIPPPGQLPFSGSKSGLSFLNATTGWVTGRIPVNGYILLYRTYDGGNTWYPQSLPLSPTERSSQLSILPPLFFNATDGILPVSFDMGKGASLDVYVTHDGGTTWKRTTPLTAAASTADFIDVDHGWASDGTLLYVTGDGGKQWTTLSPGGSFQHIMHLDFVSSDIGWAIGATAANAPTLLKTEDGGHTWTAIPYTIS
jgi:photosystem II stability/assembly factor-like uncharacterized protein